MDIKTETTKRQRQHYQQQPIRKLCCPDCDGGKLSFLLLRATHGIPQLITLVDAQRQFLLFRGIGILLITHRKSEISAFPELNCNLNLQPTNCKG